MPDPLTILGELYVAFGQGTGTVEVMAETVDEIRRGCLPIFQDPENAALWSSAEWRDPALARMKQFGVKAAEIAQSHNPGISKQDFHDAVKSVLSGFVPLTIWCVLLLQYLGLEIANV